MTEQTTPACSHWDGSARQTCRTVDDVRLYATGLRCPQHTPAALAGRTEPETAPGRPAQPPRPDQGHGPTLPPHLTPGAAS